MYKLAPTAAEVPANVSLVTMNADGEALPSDWYLRVARESGRMLRNEIPLSPQMPLASPGSSGRWFVSAQRLQVGVLSTTKVGSGEPTSF